MQTINIANSALEQGGLLLKGGAMVNAGIIDSAPSTKSRDKQCDPEMH